MLENNHDISAQPLTLKLMSPLKDQTVFEEETVILTCKLSKPDQEVKWFKKGNAMAIQPGAKYSMITEGTTYSLIIKNADKKDANEFTCKCGLFINTKAQVTVKGERWENESCSNLLPIHSRVRKRADFPLLHHRLNKIIQNHICHIFQNVL